MEFFVQPNHPKVLRTNLYGDQEFSRFELELIHTPIFQRLYDLKQLGFTDHVYPDAVHSRFNHLLGVVSVTESMAHRVLNWLDGQPTKIFHYNSTNNYTQWQSKEIDGKQLFNNLKFALPSLRLMALLHDLTHAAYGHTLEDEIHLFIEKHDEPARQLRFFDTITAQLVIIWAQELGIRNEDLVGELQRTQHFEISEKVIEICVGFLEGKLRDSANWNDFHNCLDNLERAFRRLLFLEKTHITPENGGTEHFDELRNIDCTELLITNVRKLLNPDAKNISVDLYGEMYLIDMIGNTICADLLDYAKRDSVNAGLRVSFDDRVLRYLRIAAVSGELVPHGKRALRLAIQFYTNKLRNDVLSELSAILKARYLIAERMIFHPTKCAAGACLGTAVQLLGIADIPPRVQALGDAQFLSLLERSASGLERLAIRLQEVSPSLSFDDLREVATRVAKEEWLADDDFREILLASFAGSLEKVKRSGESCEASENTLKQIEAYAKASTRVLWRLKSRRYPKLCYRLLGAAHHGGTGTAELAKKYSNPSARYELERAIERMSNLPLGTVFIHCPRRTANMKLAHAIVLGDNEGNAKHLRDLEKAYAHDDKELLTPYQNEINAIEEMYRSIWRIHVYIDSAYVESIELVAAVAAMPPPFGFGLANDPSLAIDHEKVITPKLQLFHELLNQIDDVARNNIPRVIRELERNAMQLNHAKFGESLENESIKKIVERAIRSASLGSNLSDTRGVPARL